MRLTPVILLITFIIQSSPAYCKDTVSSGKPAGTSLDRLVARVNSEPITELEVQALRKDNPELSFTAALDVLIDQRMVLSWAKSNGITVLEREILKTEQAIMENNGIPGDRFDEVLAARGQNRETFRDDLRNQILVNKAMSKALEPAIRIDEQEIEKIYNEDYPPRRTFTLRHILLKPDTADGRDEAATMDLAVRIMKQIREGASFEDMALEYSADRDSAAEGGFLGTFSQGELLPELEEVALELEPGEIGGPVETSNGIHIISVDEKGLTQPPPLSQVRDKIRADLISRREPEVREKWLRELKEKAFIEVFADGE